MELRAVALLTLLLASSAFCAALTAAVHATWLLNPGAGDFNTAANWTPATVSTGTAFFNAPNVASIESDDASIVFDHDCQLGLEEIA